MLKAQRPTLNSEIRGRHGRRYSFEDESASIRQILDAGNCLDGDNLPRFDRSDVGGAHVTFPGSVSALDRSADLARCAQRDSIRNSKTRSPHGIRDPGNAALACASQWHSLANEDVDLVSRRR